MTANLAPDRVVTTFTFLGHIPSKKNSKRVFHQGGRIRMLSSEAYLQWESEELASLLNAPKLYPPYSIAINTYPGTLHPWDLSNRVESLNDVLVKAGVLEDDNWFAIQSLKVDFISVDINNPRTEYVVTSNPVKASIAEIKSEIGIDVKLQRKMQRIQQRLNRR